MHNLFHASSRQGRAGRNCGVGLAADEGRLDLGGLESFSGLVRDLGMLQ